MNCIVERNCFVEMNCFAKNCFVKNYFAENFGIANFGILEIAVQEYKVHSNFVDIIVVEYVEELVQDIVVDTCNGGEGAGWNTCCSEYMIPFDIQKLIYDTSCNNCPFINERNLNLRSPVFFFN